MQPRYKPVSVSQLLLGSFKGPVVTIECVKYCNSDNNLPRSYLYCPLAAGSTPNYRGLG